MKSPKFKKQLGLTLIELMLVLALLTVLMTVAYPLYNEHTQRVRRAEAITALSIVAAEQERFYTVNGAYSSMLTELDVPAKWQVDGETENGHYALNLTTTNSDQGFLAEAIAQGAQSGDEDCDIFSINHLGIKSAAASVGSTGDPSKCWQH